MKNLVYLLLMAVLVIISSSLSSGTSIVTVEDYCFGTNGGNYDVLDEAMYKDNLTYYDIYNSNIICNYAENVSGCLTCLEESYAKLKREKTRNTILTALFIFLILGSLFYLEKERQFYKKNKKHLYKFSMLTIVLGIIIVAIGILAGLLFAWIYFLFN